MPKDIAIDKLTPHPRNVEIYGEESVSDLVAQIEERGKIVIPLVINKENVILSGHRRWTAAKALGFTKVPCEVRTSESPEEELEFLLHSNVTRKKSKEQIAREGIVLEEVLSTQSLERRKANLRHYRPERDESSHSTESLSDDNSVAADETTDIATGRTRDEVAKALRIGSGKQFDRMKTVVKKIDDLKTQGKSEESDLLSSILNRAPSAAYDLLEVDLTSLSDEDKKNLKTGKISPRRFAPKDKAKNEKVKRETPYGNAIGYIKEIESQIKRLTEDISNVKKGEQRQKLLERIAKQIESLQSLLPTSEPLASKDVDIVKVRMLPASDSLDPESEDKVKVRVLVNEE